MRTQTPSRQVDRELKKRFNRMAAKWSENRRSHRSQEHLQRDCNETAADQLLRHVLGAAMRCEMPTTENIATDAGICVECCHDVMQVAQAIGFADYEPALDMV